MPACPRHEYLHWNNAKSSFVRRFDDEADRRLAIGARAALDTADKQRRSQPSLTRIASSSIATSPASF